MTDHASMERTETTVVETVPEKKQAAVQRQQEFGWTLVSAQEDTHLSGGQSRKRVKLLFTRTASSAWLEDMKHLEKELADLDGSVTIGSDRLVILGDKPTLNLPIPILIIIGSTGYLIGWFIYEIVGGIGLGIISAAVSWAVYRQQGKKKLAKHTAARRKATDTFKKKRHELLVRIRAHANTRESAA